MGRRWNRAFVPFAGLLLLIGCSHAKTVSLLNTVNSVDELGWPTYGDGGWFEETFTKDGNNRRAYVACDLGQSTSGDNWLFLPPVHRNETHNSNRVTLHLNYSLRECPRDDPSATKCKETFEVYMRKQKRGEPAPSFDKFDNERNYWRLMRRWAGGARSLTGPDGARMQLGDDKDVVELNDDDESVYFALRDDYACISIMGAEITYDICEATTLSFAQFPAMTTAFEMHEYKKVEGKCVEGAEWAAEQRNPSANCKGDGQWEVSEGCVCSPGYYGLHGACLACPEGQVSGRNATMCTSCPRYSRPVLSLTGEKRCECDNGYFRVDEHDFTQLCYSPPSRPRSVTASMVTQSDAVLLWQEPESKGGLKDVWYEWRCSSCSAESNARLSPPTRRTSNTTLHISGLQPGESYTIEVIALNAVSSKSERPPDVGAIVVTANPPLPHAVGPLKITTETDARDSITIAWAPPALPKHVRTYEVETRHGNSVEAIITNVPEYTLTNLKHGVEYHIRVRADVDGWGQWSESLVYTGGKGISLSRRISTSVVWMP